MSKKQKGVAKEIRKTERVLTTLGLTPERRWVETLRQDNREAYSQLQSLTHLISTHHDDTVAVGSLFRLRAGGVDADEMAVTAVASEASGCRRLCDRPKKAAGPVYSDLSTRKLCKWATAHLTTADKQTKKTVRGMKLAQLLYWMLHCEQIHSAAAEADATQRCGGLIVVDEKHQRAYYLTSDQASLRMGPVFAMRLPVTSAETNLAMMQKTVTALRELVAGLRATAEATVTKKRPRREPRPKETLVYVEVSEGEEDSECETLGSVDTDDGSDGDNDGYDDCAVMSDDDDASFAEYSDEDDADDSGTSAADSESDSESVSDRY